MRSLLRNFMLALPLAGSVVCEEPQSPANLIYRNAQEAFQDLLDALPEDSLHAALNSLTKFKDGVFESDRHGVERVHHDNPPLATKLIVAAVQDLRKRQNNPAPTNGTEPSTSPTDSVNDNTSEPPTQTPSETANNDPTETPSNPPSNPPSSTPSQEPTQTPSQEPTQAPSSNDTPSPPSSRESAVIVPVPVTTTDDNGRPTVVSSEILSKPTAAITIPVTRTNEQGETEVVQETKPAVIFTATDSNGRPSVVTSAVEFAPTPGQVLTRTNDEGSTFLTTYTPGGGRVSSIVLITTTNENGEVGVVTSYTYVEPAAATETGEGGAGGSGTTAKPGLQTGAANHNSAMGAVVAMGGLLAFLM